MSESGATHHGDPQTLPEGFPGSRDTFESRCSLWDTPLREGQIRLFNIQLDDDDSIKGTLKVFEHMSAPNYIAQSYVCGDGDNLVEINVSGSSHFIKPNLSVALRQTKKALRKRNSRTDLSSWTPTTWLWIDAVCIHQSDEKELEMQIRFMEHIYRRASATFVSFGPLRKSYRLVSQVSSWSAAEAKISQLHITTDHQSTTETGASVTETARLTQFRHEQRLQADHDISRDVLKIIDAELRTKGSEHQRHSSDFDRSSQALHYLHPFWQACMRLFDAKWFSRLWTYQELALSRRLFVTLPTCVPWSRLRAIYRSLRRLNVKGDILTPQNRLSEERTRFNRFLRMHILQASPFRKLPMDRDNIWSLLVITAQRRARKPKDHVFGLFGLIDTDTRELVNVDYSKTDAEVFAGMVELAMTTTNAARRLPKLWEDFAWVPQMTPHLPSWCPDLNNKTCARIGWYSFKDLPAAVSEAFLDAAYLRTSNNSGPIFLKTLELDTVSQSSMKPCPEWAGARPVLSDENHVFAADATTLLWTKHLYSTFCSDEESSQDTVMRLQHFFGVFTGLRQNKMAALVCLMTASQLLREGLTLDEVVHHVRERMDPGNEHHRSISRKLNVDPNHQSLANSVIWMADVLRGNFGGTYVFITACGRFGHSPKPVSTGDKICIVPGGRFLHVFSNDSKRHVTCAAAYGLMDQSLLQIARELGREWQVIEVH